MVGSQNDQGKYGGLMEAGGNDLKEFLINLPLFHNRVMLFILS
jgi:hypothetical protein